MKRAPHVLHVHTSGEGGPSVILLHGLAGSWRYWAPALGTITQHRRAVCPDLLGFGRSAWPARCGYTVDDHLFALEHSLRPYLSEPVDIVGHSLGALLALELAARLGDRVRSLSLLAFPYYDDDEQARSYVRHAFWGRSLIDHPRQARLACSLICQRRRVWKHLLPPLLPDVPREVVEDGMLHSFASVSRTLHRCIIEHRVDASATRLQERGVRMRIVVGEDDPVAPPERARAFASRYSLAEVEVIRGAEHAFPLTHYSWNRRILSCGCGHECSMFSMPMSQSVDVEPAD